MVKICPVSFRQINENLSRFNAGFTLLMVIFFLLTQSPVFILVMTFDFFMRNIYQGRLNPVTHFNNYLIQVIKIPSHLINAGPKIFAARVGLGLSILSCLFFFSENYNAAIGITVILAVFSFLEMTFNYCVACKMYPFLLPLNKYFEKESQE